jgi:phosphoglycerate dehydrogenase-like enzyme
MVRIPSQRIVVVTSKNDIAIAILDDYQNVSLQFADWSRVQARAKVTVFNDHLADPQALVDRLERFDVVCVMRERTPLTRDIIGALPRLKLIASTGRRNASIDMDAAKERGIEVAGTDSLASPPIELTWALILASSRHVVEENAALDSGGWQHSIGDDLSGKTLGILGLGRIGTQVAHIGKAFGMNVIAWSEHLTDEAAAEVGVRRVEKDELLRQSDIVTIHLVLSDTTRGLVSAREFGLMKSTARLINTSRGPIVVEADLIGALNQGRIAGAALDVYDTEPLPANHPLRHTPRLLATPHIGYVTRGVYERFYQGTVDNIIAWMDRN